MKTSSAKAKGRKLQQWVVEKLVAILAFDPEDLESRPMGSSGEDVIMGVRVAGDGLRAEPELGLRLGDTDDLGLATIDAADDDVTGLESSPGGSARGEELSTP